jgi:hypothetical protein
MSNIISASRRTDIPAFYSEWFMERLQAGEVDVSNPFNNITYKVSLKPNDVSCIVFWSKNFSPLLSSLEEIEKVSPRLYFHFTITGVPKDLELHTPSCRDAVKDFIYLSKRYSPQQIVWRFDPICITDKVQFEHYEDAFAELAGMLRGQCVKTYISFVQRYQKTDRNVERYSSHRLVDITEKDMRAYSEKLARIASSNRMTLHACCNDFLLSGQIEKAHCIHKDELNKAFGIADLTGSRKPTRKGCGCTNSKDIGRYDTCPHGCLYCYANSDKERIEREYQESGGNMLE